MSEEKKQEVIQSLGFNNEVKVVFEDGREQSYPKFTTFNDIRLDQDNKDDIIGIKVNNKIVSLNDSLERDTKVEFLTIKDMDGNRIYAAGLKMLFEYAVYNVFPEIKVKYSYALPRGIVAELDSDQYLLNDDVAKIKNAMALLVEEDLPIEKITVKANDGIRYYEDIGKSEKAENIQNITDNVVLLYRINDLVNYYYSEMPVSTKILNRYELVYLGKNRIVINYPIEFDNGNLPEFVNYKGILEAYIHGQYWLNVMKLPYINNVNNMISSGKIGNFSKSCELGFNMNIKKVATKIYEDGNIKCVMIAGPSSSGKTTITKRLGNYLEIFGFDPIVISLDDYFRNRNDSPIGEDGQPDFECLQAVDLEYLSNDVKRLFNGETIEVPYYNFITGTREFHGKNIKIKDNSIVLFEGLHALNDDLLPIIPDTLKYKIYISPFNPLCLDEHNFISCYDLRLLRRIVRDFQTRGRNVEETMESWIKVRQGEEKYVIPFSHHADTILNTSLAYEVGVLKVFAEPLLFKVSSQSIYYNEARRLLNFLKQFFPISSENVPGDSIIREFIGGSHD